MSAFKCECQRECVCGCVCVRRGSGNQRRRGQDRRKHSDPALVSWGDRPPHGRATGRRLGCVPGSHVCSPRGRVSPADWAGEASPPPRSPLEARGRSELGRRCALDCHPTGEDILWASLPRMPNGPAQGQLPCPARRGWGGRVTCTPYAPSVLTARQVPGLPVESVNDVGPETLLRHQSSENVGASVGGLRGQRQVDPG